MHAAEDLLQIVTDGHVIAEGATAKKVSSASSVTLPDEGIAHLARTCLDRFLRPISFAVTTSQKMESIPMHAR